MSSIIQSYELHPEDGQFIEILDHPEEQSASGVSGQTEDVLAREAWQFLEDSMALAIQVGRFNRG